MIPFKLLRSTYMDAKGWSREKDVIACIEKLWNGLEEREKALATIRDAMADLAAAEADR